MPRRVFKAVLRKAKRGGARDPGAVAAAACMRVKKKKKKKKKK